MTGVIASEVSALGAEVIDIGRVDVQGSRAQVVAAPGV